MRVQIDAPNATLGAIAAVATSATNHTLRDSIKNLLPISAGCQGYCVLGQTLARERERKGRTADRCHAPLPVLLLPASFRVFTAFRAFARNAGERSAPGPAVTGRRGCPARSDRGCRDLMNSQAGGFVPEPTAARGLI